jgi:group I intron endonuclease
MNGIVYIIKNMVDGKVYVGQTQRTLEERWEEHISPTQYNSVALHQAMVVHGVSSFEVNTLEVNVPSQPMLSELEKKWILLLRAYHPDYGYNKTYGGEQGWTLNYADRLRLEALFEEIRNHYYSIKSGRDRRTCRMIRDNFRAGRMGVVEVAEALRALEPIEELLNTHLQGKRVSISFLKQGSLCSKQEVVFVRKPIAV